MKLWPWIYIGLAFHITRNKTMDSSAGFFVFGSYKPSLKTWNYLEKTWDNSSLHLWKRRIWHANKNNIIYFNKAGVYIPT